MAAARIPVQLSWIRQAGSGLELKHISLEIFTADLQSRVYARMVKGDTVLSQLMRVATAGRRSPLLKTKH
jgi:hypothetical protein